MRCSHRTPCQVFVLKGHAEWISEPEPFMMSERRVASVDPSMRKDQHRSKPYMSNHLAHVFPSTSPFVMGCCRQVPVHQSRHFLKLSKVGLHHIWVDHSCNQCLPLISSDSARPLSGARTSCTSTTSHHSCNTSYMFANLGTPFCSTPHAFQVTLLKLIVSQKERSTRIPCVFFSV